MANFVYTRAKVDIMKGLINLHTAGDDIRAIIVMTNSTADVDEDAVTCGGFTTLDEHDGSGYVIKALANEVVNEDAVNDRGEFDADNITWTSLGAGTRAIKGIVIIKFVTSVALSQPIAWIDTPSPPNSNGGDWTASWNVEGIVQGG